MKITAKTLAMICRFIAGGICFALSFYLFASVLTSGYSIPLSELGGCVVVTLLVAPLVFFGLPWRRVLPASCALTLSSICTAVIFVRAQELWEVHRFGDSPTEPVYVRRWWPFGHHTISFVPDHGWTGCD